MELLRGYARAVTALLLLVLFLAALLTAGSTPGELFPTPYPPGDSHLLITEVYYNGYLTDEPEEFVRLHNPTLQEVSLAGWSVSDGRRKAVFGAGAVLEPGASVYVAREALAFLQEMGRLPDFEFAADTHPAVPNLQVTSPPPRWANRGGVVILEDNRGQAVDVVVYGDGGGYRGPGWKGPPVPLGAEGEILDRARDESTITATSGGRYVPDTDTGRDWWQGNAWKDLRVHQRGQTFMPYPTFPARSVTAYSSPDSTYRVLTSLIDSARLSIDVCVYEFYLVQLAERLVAARRRGVRVRLLLEGGPVGGVVDQGRHVAKMIHDAGGEVRFIIHDPHNRTWDRYEFIQVR
jgi:cardiolipin synthase A/B